MSSKRPRWLSTCYHPLLIGSAILLSILYKIFPSVFVLLAKSFPIALCTVLLLGKLLIYGESNTPRAKEEGGKDASRDVMIKNQDQVPNAVKRRKNSGDQVQVKERKAVMALAEMNNVAQQLGASSEASDTCHATADENEPVGSNADPDRHIREHNSVSPCHGHGHAHHCRASAESEHNSEESSEASEADVMPLLDELDPLLDPEVNQAALAANNVSDAGLRDRDSNDDSTAEEAGIKDDEEDDETQEEKEDENKVAITWTADDQSNLVHLGNSELERNRRLESLIAKRRARKIPQYRIDKNLIDLDGHDSLPSAEEISRLNAQLSTIYAPKKNPFDLAYDADDIPGSAPSILLQRRNPFYQARQEEGIGSSNLGSQVFLAATSRDPLFRRHESFTIGASLFGNVDQDIFDYRFKPYFSNEREEDEKIFSELYRSDTSGSKVSSDTDPSDTDQEHQESESDPKLVAESTDQENESSKEIESTDDKNVMNEINVGADCEAHADNYTSKEPTHQSAQVLGPAEDVDSIVSDVENVKVLGDGHETHADKSISEEQTRQSAQVLGAAEDKTSKDLGADSIVSDAENIEVLGDDHETHADNDIAGEQIHQSAQVFGSAEDETSEELEVDFIVSDVEKVKVPDGDHETLADKDISVEQTHQSAQVPGAVEDKTSEDLEAIAGADNVEVLDGDHETVADKDTSVELTHQSDQVLGQVKDKISEDLETIADADGVQVLDGDHETQEVETSDDLEADSTVSDYENVKVLYGDHETHADKDTSVEQTHRSAQVLGAAEDESSEKPEINSLNSDAENVRVLGEDNKSKSSFLSDSCERPKTEEPPIEKEKMEHALSHDVVDPVKEVNEESGNMKEQVEQVLPVYDSSPSATEGSKSFFSTVPDETLISTDKDALALDNSSWIKSEEINSGDGSLTRTSES